MRQEKKKSGCYLCDNKIDFRYLTFLSRSLLETCKIFKYGKIWPKKITGLCSNHQRNGSSKIKFMVNLALLPGCTGHMNDY